MFPPSLFNVLVSNSIMDTTSYDSKMIKHKYKQVLEEFHNRNKPELLNYEKEYIRLWNLSGNSRKSIITDVEREVLDHLDLLFPLIK